MSHLPASIRVQIAVGLYALFGGLVTLVGWYSETPRLTDWGGDGISMLPNTAVACLLSGAALLLLAFDRSRWCLRGAQAVAGVVALIGLLTLTQHVTGANLGFDTLLISRTWGQTATTSPMRMGPPASAAFLLLGTALLLVTRGPKERYAASLLAVLTLAISSLSLTGYSFGADQLFGVARYTGIALQTSTILAALAVGVLAATPGHGVVAALWRDDIGGRILRRLIVPIMGLPFLLGWLSVLGESLELYDAAFGSALLILSQVALFIVLLWWTAWSVSRFSRTADLATTRLGAIVESTKDAVVSKSLDGTIQSWNSGAESLFGYSAEEAIGQPISIIVPEDRAAEEEGILSRLVQGQPVEDLETVRLTKSGDRVDVSLCVSPVYDRHGRIIAASKIARDVTDRKRQDEALRRSERELRALADSMPQLAWMAHPDGHIFWYNRGWHEYTGKTFEEMEGWGWQSVHDPKMLPQVLSRWRHSLETGEPFELEFPLRGADGEFRWFLTRVRPVYDEAGKVARWFGTNTDIDQVKHVEQRLLEQAQTLELLNQSAMIVGSTLDLRQLLESITNIAAQLSGAEFGLFLHTPPGDSQRSFSCTTSGEPPVDPASLDAGFLNALFGEGPQSRLVMRSDDILGDPQFTAAAQAFDADPQQKQVRSLLTAPIIAGRGRLIGGLVFGHSEVGMFSEQVERIIGGIASQASVALDNARLYLDLKQAADERLRLLERERAARSEAERVNRMKDEFLATLSHELRTPLGAILGWAQILAMGDYDEQELEEGLEAIESNAKAQTQLIEDLLDMSRIISGKIVLDVSRTNLPALLGEAVESVRYAAKAKKIKLKTHLDPAVNEAHVDPSRVRQVVWNLLSNAIKFTPAEGRVEMTVKAVSPGVEIAVSDTGIGISPDFLPMVFERFRQADSSSTRNYGGLGLGLSIVKNLVEMHGGSVHAHSEGEGQGSTFSVTLPLRPLDASDEDNPVPAKTPVPVERELAHLPGVQVLVIEDQRHARALLTRLLSRTGAEVLTASSASEGLDALTEIAPDVIVSDIGMPGMDGYEFMRRVRALDKQHGGGVPAIALTAFARDEDRAAAFAAGYQMHVSKPVDADVLLSAINRLVTRDGKPRADGFRDVVNGTNPARAGLSEN